MRDRIFGGTGRVKRGIVAVPYLAIVKILQSFGSYDHRNERYAAVIRELLSSELHKARVVVDLGCGQGLLTALLGGPQLLVGIDTIHVDRQPSNEPEFHRIQGLAERLPLRSGCVEIAIAISLLEHITDQSAFFRELARILEPGGYALLQIPELRFPIEPHTKWPLLYVWRSSIRNRVLSATGYEDLNLSTSLGETTRLATTAGFAARRIVPIWHLRLARMLRLSMGYFTLFRKGAE